MSVGCAIGFVEEQETGGPRLSSRLGRRIELFHDGIVVSADVHLHGEDAPALGLDEGARALSPVRSMTMRSHSFLGRPEDSRPVQSPIGAPGPLS